MEQNVSWNKVIEKNFSPRPGLKLDWIHNPLLEPGSHLAIFAELTICICENAQVIIPKDVKSIQVVDFLWKALPKGLGVLSGIWLELHYSEFSSADICWASIVFKLWCSVGIRLKKKGPFLLVAQNLVSSKQNKFNQRQPWHLFSSFWQWNMEVQKRQTHSN